MSINDTIKILRRMTTFYASFADSERANALYEAIKHLEKDDAMELNVGENGICGCPKCGYLWNEKIEDITSNYCPNCGQRIKYEKE